MVMKAEWLAAENKLDEALERAKAAVAADPQSTPAHLALAVVYDRRGQASDAIKAYAEVTRLDPRNDRALVALSRLNLGRDRDLAIRQAEEARRVDPSNGDARIALARSLIAAGSLQRAEAEIDVLLKAAPGVAGVHALMGTLQASKRDAVAARSSYERALAISPGYFEALAGLTYLDLEARIPAQAVARLEGHMAKEPPTAQLLALTARAYSAAGDPTKAEQALRRAVAVDPGFTPGYEQLARLYVQQRKLDQARTEFEGIARRDPSAVGAKTMVGMLLEAQGRRDDARTWYEGMLSGTADAPVAANNLAFIYAEQGTNLDIALQLATSAKPKLPDDPNVDDTIGWVYYKKNLPASAVGPLEESLKRRPDNAEVLYHLGLTYAKLGNTEKARGALGRALKLEPGVGGAEAQRVLASVSQ
jgi:tetratricopeptide (TPR) repeat protein